MLECRQDIFWDISLAFALIGVLARTMMLSQSKTEDTVKRSQSDDRIENSTYFCKCTNNSNTNGMNLSTVCQPPHKCNHIHEKIYSIPFNGWVDRCYCILNSPIDNIVHTRVHIVHFELTCSHETNIGRANKLQIVKHYTYSKTYYCRPATTQSCNDGRDSCLIQQSQTERTVYLAENGEQS